MQVYVYDALAKGLETLDNFSKRDPMLLHNALLGLYARDLYQDVCSLSLDQSLDFPDYIYVYIFFPSFF